MTSKVQPLWLYLPLWGVDFDSDDMALLGGQVLAGTPHPEEWYQIQQHEVMIERLRLAQLPIQYNAPVCLTVVESRFHNETLSQVVKRIGTKMLFQARTAVLALRLHKPGWFLDPEQGETCFTINEKGWHIQRIPGPYRQAFLAGLDDIPFDGYTLKINELTSPGHLHQPGGISLLWDQLIEIREKSDNASLEIALENFNRSYGFQFYPSQRLAYLFIALDAILGGFNETEPGGFKLSGRGGKFYPRVKAAFIITGQNPIEAGRMAAWLNGHKPGEGRWLRNSIAHGDTVDNGRSTVAAQLIVQNMVRVLLCQYLRFLVRWNDEHLDILLRFSLPKSCSPVGAYNAILAHCVQKNDAANDLLC